jgi:hypothetical protein
MFLSHANVLRTLQIFLNPQNALEPAWKISWKMILEPYKGFEIQKNFQCISCCITLSSNMTAADSSIETAVFYFGAKGSGFDSRLKPRYFDVSLIIVKKQNTFRLKSLVLHIRLNLSTAGKCKNKFWINGHA